MKYLGLAALAIAALPVVAQARDHVGFFFGFGGAGFGFFNNHVAVDVLAPAPIYAEPHYVYVAPACPEPAVTVVAPPTYCAPPVVYCPAPTVYVAPAPFYYAPVYAPHYGPRVYSYPERHFYR